MRNWLKTWGFPGLAILISLGAVIVTYMMYQGATVHDKHTEIYNELIMLDYRIQRAIYLAPEDDDETEHMIIKAIDWRHSAEEAWNEGRYAQANYCIQKSLDVISNLPIPKQVPPAMPPAIPIPAPTRINFWLIGGIIVMVIIAAIVIYLTVVRQRA